MTHWTRPIVGSLLFLAAAAPVGAQLVTRGPAAQSVRLASQHVEGSRVSGCDERGPSSESPLDQDGANQIIGIGGGAGGRYGGRFFAKRKRQAAGAADALASIEAGLDWLTANGPDAESAPSVRSEALTLLALLGDGHVMTRGSHKQQVQDLFKQLRNRFDRDSGRFVDRPGSEPAGADPLLDHLLAMLALTEAFYFDRSVIAKKIVTDALPGTESLLSEREQRARLTPAALTILLELEQLAGAARIRSKVLPLVRDEIEWRVAEGNASLVLDAAHLQCVERGLSRDTLATGIAKRAIETWLPDGAEDGSGPECSPAEALQLWRVAEALHAVGGEAWTTFQSRRRTALVASQEKDGPARGSWEPSLDGAADSDVIPFTAALVLSLEADYRIAPTKR